MRSIVPVALVMTACSALTNLDDLRGDGALAEGSAEASPIDASGDDSSDASIDADAPQDFCAPYADVALVYCQSFDTVDDAGAITTSGGGVTVSIDDADSVSAPSSLLIGVPPILAPDGGSLRAFVSYTVAAQPMIDTVDFAFKLLSPTTAQFNIAAMGANSGSGNRSISLLFLPTYVTLQENIPTDAGSTYVLHPNVAFTFDTNWHQVHIVLDLTTKRTSYAIDGTTLEANYPLSPGWVKGTPTVSVGLTYAAPSDAGFSVRTDNVLVQLAL